MATLVLSTVGTLLGGPVGGAIGSLLGQSIDQQLLGPGPRDGPRLGDLSVQTSSYGTPIPRLFGTMRVAGSIIWSTDLEEASETQGAKGQPETVTYSYSASFAVALSSRTVGTIGRIWADGKLIRSADGVFTVSTGFRFHDGSENQPVDPLIASIEGPDSAPAYRGIALAVFEHLDLADFGNRIPFLTFEVEADSGAVPVQAILEEVSGGAIAARSGSALTGYAAHGATALTAVEPLVEVIGMPLFDNGEFLISPTDDVMVVADGELGCWVGEEPTARIERSQIPFRRLPATVSLGYYDPDREYQSGIARAAVATSAAVDEKIELPAVLHATAAKALAESSLARRWAGRDRVTLRLPPAYLPIRPGALLKFGETEPWRAERVVIEAMAVAVELCPLYAVIDSVPADPGRVLPSLGVEPAPTTVTVVEVAEDGTGGSDAPVLAVAASSTSSSWRAIPLEVEVGGEVYVTRTAQARTILGTAATALPNGQAVAFDRLNSVDVELIDPAQWLESRDDTALSEMANLAIVGDELIQFGAAVPLGSGRFRLSRLLRGRRGTEWAMNGHNAGERFALIDAGRLKPLSLTSGQVGAIVRVKPKGIGDSAAIATEHQVSGEAMRPLSPAHLRAWFDAEGSLHIAWVRRSRRGWAWLDGVDAPLDCSTERYLVTVRNASARLEVETVLPQAQMSAADLSALGTEPIELSVAQLGDLGVSRPASVTISRS